jgi:thiosulfate reductase cytochrome b subunit
MTAAQQRKAQRRVHLAAALLLIAYLYAPLEAQLQDAVRFVGLPALVVTGVAMWQAPRVRRLRKRLGGTPARPDRVSASGRAERGTVTST